MPASMLTRVIAFCSLLPAAALPAGRDALPRFEDYPAIDRLEGAPKEPVLRLPVQRSYKTRLRRGILTGEGLVGVDTPARPPLPNFAGAFYAIAWGCGSDACAALAIVDGRTGAVYGPPPTADPPRDGFVATPRTTYCEGIGLRPDSRLIFIEHMHYSDSGEASCHRTYYEWRDFRYRLLRKTQVKPSR